MIRNTYRDFHPGKPVALVGMPGVGKTTLGKLLADCFGVPFFDSDNMVEKAAGGLSVSTIYEQFGEDAFRSAERDVIRRVLMEQPCHVLATGEGAFLDPTTRMLLLEKTCTVYMSATSAHLADRLSRKARPQLGLPQLQMPETGQDTAESGEQRNTALEQVLETMHKERDRLYGMADVCVFSAPGSYEETLDQVLRALKQHLFHSA